MDRIKWLGERGVAGCALTNQIVEREELPVGRRIEQLLEPIFVYVERCVFMAREGIGVCEGTVVFDPIVFREVMEVEFPAVSADDGTGDAEHNG